MKKVCIIAPSSLSYVPYLRCYEEVLKETETAYDIYYWDRYGLDEVKENAFGYLQGGTSSGVSIIPAYLRYRNFLLERLKCATYDTYIVLSTQMGVLLYDFLRSKPFILDIRDYSHEALLPYRLAVNKLVKHAKLVCISSQGFLDWLPNNCNYTLSHNLTSAELNKSPTAFDKSKKILSYIGAVSYFKANTKLIESLKYDAIEINYIGRGTCDEQLKQYCLDQNITNVFFHGAYSPDQKERFYHNTNFVIGCYGSDNMIVRTLTPNRLYESCLYHRPIIVNSGTHLSSIVKENGLGIVVDMDNLNYISKQLELYYDPIFFEEYAERCDLFLNKVVKDIEHFREQVVLSISSNSAT